MRIACLLFALIALVDLTSCVDMYDPVLWSNGHFTLEYVDALENASLRSEDTLEAVIPNSVFEVGSNDTYIVAKQHPNRDLSITNYFYINTQEFPRVQPFIPSEHVIGPLTKDEFLKKSVELQLPEFSFSIESLK